MNKNEVFCTTKKKQKIKQENSENPREALCRVHFVIAFILSESTFDSIE
jgi:hypothetical protein